MAWNRTLLGSGLACLASLVTTVAAATDDVDASRSRELHLGLAPSVLKIEAALPGRYAVGSALVVGPELVVTNCHVTRDARAIEVLHGGLRYPVRGQRADMARDLCLLRAPGLGAKPVKLGAASSLRRRQPMLAIGYTGGAGLQFSEGELVDTHRLDDGAVIQSSNWFSSGASGGGLFDAEGKLVGVLTFRLRGGERHYYSAPVEWLRALVDAPLSDERPVAPLSGQTFWELRDERQPPFLRAAALVQGAEWEQLLDVALRWAADDATDPEPQRLLGLALTRLERPAEAVVAYQRALALDAGDAPSWFQLGALQHRLGQDAQARAALEQLDALDTELAQRLQARLRAQ
ncbi:S1 family peptidase [Rivibacter subsaxonicus]|uniref:Tetratricopeptide repeat protein n=1 Tax=Rivibacter subsaxonicus TaxID=457575 RepID=A0A4Q7VZB0_9BURK|nr:trypsin-like peptidase domain-containing protein [Rivibacter subsaxonicus]RZU02222.1 tetratricopeptide repeat protein [Rivibacter subsaxonicus]